MANTDPAIANLPTDYLWLRTEAGRLVLGDALVATRKEKLPLACRFALAFTQAACTHGRGKFYHMVPHPWHYSGFRPEAEFFEAFVAFKNVPELFYIPYAWSSEEQRRWKSMKAVEQLHLLDARHQWLDDCCPILPLEIDYKDPNDPNPPLELDATNGAAYTIIMNPGLHLFATSEFRDMSKKVFEQGKDLHPINIKWVLTRGRTWRDIEHWKQRDLGALLDSLYNLFRSARSSQNTYLEFFGRLRNDSIQSFKIANDAGQPYARFGEKSSWEKVQNVERDSLG